MEEIQQTRIRCARKDSSVYPARLKELPGMPKQLYYIGSFPDDAKPTAAIVGARLCSPYGRIQAFNYGKFLSEHGVQVISGMAAGIDAEGHKGALEGGTPTFAVLGNGVDICYPSSSRGIYRRIPEKNGGIISEYEPGTKGRAYYFPARNRIISGLSDAVLVMEARVRSGSLITADMALEQGKDVYALPGPLDSPLSAGCNHLIQQGAGILLNPKNLLEEWGIETNVLCRNTEIKNEKNKKVLESTDDLVYSCVGLYPKNVDQIAQESRVEIRKLMSILVTLELQGYIREITKNYYIRIK